MPSYTTQSKVEDFLDRSLNSRESNQISDWIEAVSEYINNYTNRDFQNVSEIRYFDGNGKRELDVDNFNSINSLEILDLDGNVEETLSQGQDKDFIVFPYNKQPKYRIILEEDADIAVFPGDPEHGNIFPDRRRAVKIDASWAESTTPKDIQLATTEITANLIERAKQGGLASSESLGDYSVEYTDIEESVSKMGIKNILDSHKKYIV